MANSLTNLIQSYAVQNGIHFDDTFTGVWPAQYGTRSFSGGGQQVLNTNNGLTSTDNDGPLPGQKSWRFENGKGTGKAARLRWQVAGTESLVGQDYVRPQNFTYSVWVRVNSMDANPFYNRAFAEYTNFTGGSTSDDWYQGWYFGYVKNTNSGDPNYNLPTFNLYTGGHDIYIAADHNNDLIQYNKWYLLSIRKTKINSTTVEVEFMINGVVKETRQHTYIDVAMSTYDHGQSTTTIWVDHSLACSFLGSNSVFTQSVIQNIYNSTVPTAINVNATPITASSLITDSTIVIVANDNVEVTTSIPVSATFPSNITIDNNVNINNNITGTLTASAIIGDNVVITAGRNVSFSSTEITASALLVEPIISRAPMTASATMPNAIGSVTPNYYSLVKALNPYLYIHSGASAPVNHGYQTGTLTRGSDLISNVTSPEPLNLIAEGKSWKGTSSYNSNNFFNFTTSSTTNSFESLLSQGNYAYEAWINAFELPPESYGNIPITYAILNEPGLQLSLNQSNIAYGTNTGRSFINLRIQNGSSTFSNLTYFIDQTPISLNNWNHIVVNVYQSGINANQRLVQLWIDGSVYINQNITFTPWTSVGTTDCVMGSNAASSDFTAPFLFDEIAIYSSALTNSNIINHYQFVDTLSPNFLYFTSPLTASAQSGNHNYLVVNDINFSATPITGATLFVDPLIIAQRTINVVSDVLTASATNTNVTVYWGWTINAEPAVAFAEKPESYFLNDIYYNYVQSNIAPYRYVTFDAADETLDYGTDADYSVAPTTIGGTVVNPGIAINGKSVKTTGSSYVTDGVILNESEWNDSWGTGANSYHSAFWFQRALDDNSTTGLRVLWNLNGYKDNQHAVLYQYQNKLHMQFNNGSGTWVEQDTGTLDLFDYQRHFVVIEFDHTNNNNNIVRLYVDAVLKATVNLGAYTGSTTNASTADSGPNNEANNRPRLSVGCLITPLGSTALPVAPTNTKLIIDEIYWDKNAISQAQVTNLYAVMPDRTNKLIVATPLTASDELVMPTISRSSSVPAAPLTASVVVLQPIITANREVVIIANLMQANAELLMPGLFENRRITSDVFVATAIFNDPGIRLSVPVQPMLATAEIANRAIGDNPTDAFLGAGIRVNNNSAWSRIQPWAAWLRATDSNTIIPTREVV